MTKVHGGMGSGAAVSEIGVKKTYVHFYVLFAQCV
jgi:hypothetical protein